MNDVNPIDRSIISNIYIHDPEKETNCNSVPAYSNMSSTQPVWNIPAPVVDLNSTIHLYHSNSTLDSNSPEQLLFHKHHRYEEYDDARISKSFTRDRQCYNGIFESVAELSHCVLPYEDVEVSLSGHAEPTEYVYDTCRSHEGTAKICPDGGGSVNLLKNVTSDARRSAVILMLDHREETNELSTTNVAPRKHRKKSSRGGIITPIF